MSPSDILDRDDLMQQYKITGTWIREHGRLSGGVGKPMTWLRSEFEDYYYSWRAKERERYISGHTESAKISGEIAAVVRSINTARSRTAQTEMRGRGGSVTTS